MDDLDARIAQIRGDHEHGSRWLVRAALELLRDLAAQFTTTPEEHLQQVRQTGCDLARARPAMAALTGAVARVLSVPGGPAGIAYAANDLLQEMDRAIEHMIGYARPLLKGTILTHSLSGTVIEVINACLPAISELIVLEGRPGYEGRAAVETWHQRAVALTLITDAQAAIFLPRCQAVVVGADSILADGSILNKAGTALLAWTAHGHHIPFYVLAETLKISPRSWSGDLALLEEQTPQEVWSDAPPDVAVRNFYFDHTPAALITALISEGGILGRAEIARRAAEREQSIANLLSQQI